MELQQVLAPGLGRSPPYRVFSDRGIVAWRVLLRLAIWYQVIKV